MTKYFKVKGVLTQEVEMIVPANNAEEAEDGLRSSIRGGVLKFDKPNLHSISSKFDHETILSLKDKVVHEKFGQGVILEFEGINEQARVLVDFGELGSKWLVSKYAPLSLVK